MNKLVFSFFYSDPKNIEAYVNAGCKIMELTEPSHFYKHKIYKNEFDLEERTKYTGFEKVKELDLIVRNNIKNILKDNERITTKLKCRVRAQDVSLKDTFINSALRFKDSNNLVYISGGIDSEVMAKSFIDAGVAFTPVIFNWSFNGEIVNTFDTDYAFAFCKKHKLEPLVQTLDLKEFWCCHNGFKPFFEAYKISSPQLLSYFKMTSFMDKLFPDHTHILAGEIRFEIQKKNRNSYSILLYNRPHYSEQCAFIL